MKKKYLIISALAALTVSTFLGCTKAQFDSKYNDPSKTNNATIDGLYSAMFMNRRIFPEYRNIYTFLNEMTGRYMQTIGWVSGAKMYEPNPDYVSNRWDDFYTYAGDNWAAPLSLYREMEKLYDGLSKPEEKDGYQLFMQTGKVILYDQATQLVDIFGDIPFSEAGSLNGNGTLSLPAYDQAAGVYDSAFNGLMAISQYLATVQPSSFYVTKLSKQDFMYAGDLQKWRRYTNSLILRLAMRISNRPGSEDRAKGIVQQILGNPTLYPLIDQSTDNAELTAKSPSLLSTGMWGGWTENARNIAPGYMIDSLMKPSADPRLRIFYTLNNAGQYRGLPIEWNGTQQSTAITNGDISRLDTVTYLRNEYYPGIVMTAAEVWFIKAEALLRWNVGSGTARAAYENGIRQSITYHYDIHGRSQYGTHETAWTPAELTLMLQSPKVLFTGVLDDDLNKLFLQKWVDFGLMQSPQAWAEYRRSGYPKLHIQTDIGSTIVPTPPVRLLYPTSERQLNAKNYASVADKDNYTTKIFWAR